MAEVKSVNTEQDKVEAAFYNTIKKYKMRKNLVRQFIPKERVDRVQQERLIKQDNLYYHSASEIKFDW